jgi:hypothetical protein
MLATNLVRYVLFAALILQPSLSGAEEKLKILVAPPYKMDFKKDPNGVLRVPAGRSVVLSVKGGSEKGPFTFSFVPGSPGLGELKQLSLRRTKYIAPKKPLTINVQVLDQGSSGETLANTTFQIEVYELPSKSAPPAAAPAAPPSGEGTTAQPAEPNA